MQPSQLVVEELSAELWLYDKRIRSMFDEMLSSSDVDSQIAGATSQTLHNSIPDREVGSSYTVYTVSPTL